uniref:Uncharacterized protein n=1 Tax=Aegilops tauschii subsp. strangulata TaxID=200361 RepID=A0A453A473_AEGTS
KTGTLLIDDFHWLHDRLPSMNALDIFGKIDIVWIILKTGTLLIDFHWYIIHCLA